MKDFMPNGNFFGKLQSMLAERQLIPSRGFWLYIGAVIAVASPVTVGAYGVLSAEASRSSKVDVIFSEIQEWKNIPQQIAVIQNQITELRAKDDYYDAQVPIRQIRYEGLLTALQKLNDKLDNHTDVFVALRNDLANTNEKLDNLNDAVRGRPSYDAQHRFVK